MADSYKMQVRLSEIVPGANPRRDFGDIDALAAAIEVTGGQPLNPPVVWPDGNVYRLADGERRVRALRRLHGDDGMADVLVYPSCDEAEEAVAMLATDAKQGLTDQERARGFQRMLQLGVDVDVAAKALRRKAADVRKAAKVASIAPEQATLDQMIAAAEFEDEDEQRAVLEAANWSAKAQSIVREHERREKNAPIEAELARLGVPVAESEPARRDYEYPRWIADPDSLLEWAEGRDLDGVLATRYQWGSGFYLWVPKGEDKEPEVSPEVLAERERQQRIASALEELERHRRHAAHGRRPGRHAGPSERRARVAHEQGGRPRHRGGHRHVPEVPGLQLRDRHVDRGQLPRLVRVRHGVPAARHRGRLRAERGGPVAARAGGGQAGGDRRGGRGR